jgi:hypothetical protein
VVRFTQSPNAVVPIFVMRGDNVMEVRLEDLNVLSAIAVIELLDKSILPERFIQVLNAEEPKVFNDIGAKVSTPVPEQFWKALSPILVILEEKDATSLWQRLNAFAPIDVRFWVL